MSQLAIASRPIEQSDGLYAKEVRNIVWDKGGRPRMVGKKAKEMKLEYR